MLILYKIDSWVQNIVSILDSQACYPVLCTATTLQIERVIDVLYECEYTRAVFNINRMQKLNVK